MIKQWKKMIVMFCAVVMVLAQFTVIHGETVWNQQQTEKCLDEIAAYQMNANENPTYASMGGEWTVFALARYGAISENYKKIYIKNLKAALDNCGGVLSRRKYTEYARVVIALTALGENPENFYGYHLVKPLAEYEKITIQGLNGIVYTLIALDCGNYKIPSLPDGSSAQKTTRDNLVNALLNAQIAGGGWSLSGKDAEADMTAMVIQALIPYRDSNAKVKQAINQGMNVLGALQKNDGGFEAAGQQSCESTAQVLTAMSEAGVSVGDERFVKNGHTVLDGLLTCYHNGAFSHTKGGSVNAMATDQAMYALVSYVRHISGANRLYDMSDGLVLRITDNSTAAEGNPGKNNNNESGKSDSNNTSKNPVSGKVNTGQDSKNRQTGNQSVEESNGKVKENHNSTQNYVNQFDNEQNQAKDDEGQSMPDGQDEKNADSEKNSENGGEDLVTTSGDGIVKENKESTFTIKQEAADIGSQKNSIICYGISAGALVIIVLFVLFFYRKKIIEIVRRRDEK